MKRKKIYHVSLCKHGILGGLMYLEEGELRYCTNKLTLPQGLRRLVMPCREIAGIQKAPWHTVVITMKNGEGYRFLVFSRERFCREVQSGIESTKPGEREA